MKGAGYREKKGFYVVVGIEKNAFSDLTRGTQYLTKTDHCIINLIIDISLLVPQITSVDHLRIILRETI